MRTASWVDWLEERYSHWAIPGLHRIILAVAAITWLLGFSDPHFWERLVLVGALVKDGEWWRIFTFTVVLPYMNAIQTLLTLVFTCTLGDLLESEWGSFKHNLFFLISYLALVAVAFIDPTRLVHVLYLYTMIIVAIGTVAPNAPIYLLFPPVEIPAKIFTWVFGGLLLYWAMRGDYLEVIASSFGYLTFFAPSFISEWKAREDARRRMKKFRGEDDDKKP